LWELVLFKISLKVQGTPDNFSILHHEDPGDHIWKGMQRRTRCLPASFYSGPEYQKLSCNISILRFFRQRWFLSTDQVQFEIIDGADRQRICLTLSTFWAFIGYVNLDI